MKIYFYLANKKLFLVTLFILVGSWGCTPMKKTVSNQANQTPWVLIGHDNQVIARINTTTLPCPTITLDGKTQAMSVRAQAEVRPLRTTVNKLAESKPSLFSNTTCEAIVPKHTTSAVIADQMLPLPKAEIKRIVILGDTGCRIKKSNGQYFLQDCSDENAWPFAKIARTAATLQPDLVLHVGDYHYRESACPENNKNCANSPWGYGSDTWEADFFEPASPLLAIAPWVVVRGNHEECARAGQGWFRYLDTQPYVATRTCNNPANDDIANYSEPYAVALDKHTQIIVFDSAKTLDSAKQESDFLPKEHIQSIQYRQQLQKVSELANKPNVESFFTSHHPVLGWSSTNHLPTPLAQHSMLAKIMHDIYGNTYYPEKIRAAFHGHIHNLQIISFASNHPASFVVGNGGDSAHHDFPEPFPKDMQPAIGTVMQYFAHTKRYGFLLMEKLTADWRFQAYDANGNLLTSCTLINTRQLSCSKTGKL